VSNLSRPPPPALAEFFRRWNPPGGARPEVEAVFSEGHSNRNFLVRVGNQRCVVRLAEGDARSFGIDREAERRVLERAAELGLGAPVLYCEPAHGTLVTAWLPSRPLRVEGIGAGDTLDRLAHTLHRLHAQDLDLPAVNVVERIRVYAREVQSDDPRNWPRARRWLGIARPVMEQYRFSRWRDALCHNDLVGPNVLDTEQGLRFIDWEYAGRGDPFFDLATLAEDQGFGTLDRQRLLLAYGEVGDSAVERLYRSRVLYRLLGALWYLVRFRGARLDALPALQRQEQALDQLIRQGPDG
jgi:thiamine kinase-like enzyme